MLGDVRQGWCWICNAPPGPDCPDRGKRARTMKRVEQRQVQREIIEQLDETDDRIWLPVRLPVS